MLCLKMTADKNYIDEKDMQINRYSFGVNLISIEWIHTDGTLVPDCEFDGGKIYAEKCRI